MQKKVIVLFHLQLDTTLKVLNVDIFESTMRAEASKPVGLHRLGP